MDDADAVDVTAALLPVPQVKVLPQTQCCCCFYRFEMAKLEIVGLEPPPPPSHSDERGGENDEDRQLQRARSRRVLGVITQELEI